MDRNAFIGLTPDMVRAVWDLPMGVPPLGVEPDFDHPETNSMPLWIGNGVCLFVILVVSVARFWARFYIGHARFNWSDGLYIFSVIGTYSWVIQSFVALNGRFFGHHMWEVKFNSLDKKTVMLSVANECQWPLWMLFIKFCVFTMYLELFSVKRWMRYACYIGMSLLTCFSITSAVFHGISCRPMGGTDDIAYLAGLLSPRCIRTFAMVITQAVVNITVNLYLIVLPLPVIYKLTIPKKKKQGICAMFFFGFTGVAASAVSLCYRILLHRTKDISWSSIIPWLSATIEMTAGLAVVCIPSLTILGRRWAAGSRMTPDLKSATTRGNQQSSVKVHMVTWEGRNLPSHTVVHEKSQTRSQIHKTTEVDICVYDTVHGV